MMSLGKVPGVLGHFGQRVLPPTFPKILWEVLGRAKDSSRPPPISVADFQHDEYVATGAVCGCVMIRTLDHVHHQCSADENGMYECCVCEKKGNSNSCEKEMLAKVKEVLQPRPENIILCVQVPLLGECVPQECVPQAEGHVLRGKAAKKKKQKTEPPLRLDILLVRCDASKASHMIAIELDGRDHAHDPFRTAGPKRRRVTMSLECAYDAKCESDSRKSSAVEALGMRLLRVKKAELQGGQWIDELNSMLDSLELDAM